VSARGDVSGTFRRFAEGCPGARVRSAGIRGAPFWNTVGVVECPELIAATADWLEAEEESASGAARR
jgi:hypothetical protein